MDPKETQPFLVGPEKTTTEAERGGLTPTPTGTGNESVFRVGVASTRLNRAVREWQRRNAREFVKGNARARVGLKSPEWDIRKKVERSTEPTEKMSVAEKGTLNF